MNYDEAMKFITNTAKFGSNYGLSRTEKILEFLGNPHKRLKCIHIAGTNGKGSTTAMISKILSCSGYKVGMYTSPYLEEFEERIQINNVNIPKDALASLVERVAQAVDRVIALGYDHPTEFEIITCAMFLYFFEEKVDYAVVEVGLGGRLDSTNVVMPVLSVITSISYDHMNILGNTLSEIASEKAGIIKPGIPLVLYPQQEEALKVFERVCSERGSALIRVKENSVSLNNVTGYKQNISIETYKDTYEVELALLGEHQLLNSATAVYAVEELKVQGAEISLKSIKEALSTVSWPGRLEVMYESPLVVIDGAHNIDGILKLTSSLDVYFKYEKLVLILGILADKQVEEMVKTIVPRADHVIAVTPHSDRAELAEKLRQVIEKYGNSCEAFENYEGAFERALALCSAEDMLLASGSLYMVGDMRKIIKTKLKK